jgi:hypothetical protein
MKVDLLPPEPHPISDLDPNAANQNEWLRILKHLIKHTEVADAKFPTSNGIGAHGFSVSGFDSWLVPQLPFDHFHNQDPLSGGQGIQMLIGLRGHFDLVRQGRASFSKVMDTFSRIEPRSQNLKPSPL